MSHILIPQYSKGGGAAAGGGGGAAASAAAGGGAGAGGGMMATPGGVAGYGATPGGATGMGVASSLGFGGSSLPAASPGMGGATPGAGGGGANKPSSDANGPVGYSLPPLPPPLQLHCAFALPRSQLLHQVLRVLAASAGALRAMGDAGSADDVALRAADATDFWSATAAQTSAASASASASGSAGEGVGVERALVYHTAALSLRLLSLLVEREGAVRNKLKRLQHSQAS